MTTRILIVPSSRLRLGGRKPRRVALSSRGIERGDADRSPERDRTTHRGTSQGGLAAVSRVAQCEPGQLYAGINHSVYGLQTRRRNPIVQTRDLPIEPGQFTLTNDIDEAGPGLA